ncbi:RNA-directed DNA polymerase, eukaryota, reverse transcriptase zinc-binding domain protein [Tanacetum coccineum]|uniref:RNA-directed DNA polymerase, eukaryota, reverse transcriptase zinc-binding domain protein n=1 Tax=Tanacetum coccineum TaxID=301880 RepID=A0ABQ4Z8P9_9ASTR
MLQQELGVLDSNIDKGIMTDDILIQRTEVCKSLKDMEKLYYLEMAQKAKIKWAVEGDENSKYFHGILNKKRNQLAIYGVLADGVWEERPDTVKQEFLNHFRNRFEQPNSIRPTLDMEFPNRLSIIQKEDLEAVVSVEEIKKVIDYIHQAANRIGCGILKTPFTYLGSKVGGNMCRICSWDEVVDKLIARLQMENETSDRRKLKKALGQWSKVLASKEKGGLGVSSFYALNRALMFKWVWRFKTQKDLLWSRVIKALHGDNGRIGNCSRIGYKSVWCDIIREVEVVKAHGFDLYSYIQKKIGNGENTSFWDDVWIGDTPLKSKFSRLYALEDSKRISVASKMAQENWSGSFRRVPRSGAEQAQMEELIVLLEGTTLGNSNDRWYWSLEGSGLAIPSILCPSCGVIVETTSHVFFQCELAKDHLPKGGQLWNEPLREASWKLSKYPVELGAYNIAYEPRSAMKGQILVDFLSEALVGTPTEEFFRISAKCPNKVKNGEGGPSLTSMGHRTLKDLGQANYVIREIHIRSCRMHIGASHRLHHKMDRSKTIGHDHQKGVKNKCSMENIAERNYAPLEKLALSLLHMSRRLRRYFEAHPIKVITDQPLKQILNKAQASGKLAKYSVELGAYNIAYEPRSAMKGQVLVDFLSEALVETPTSEFFRLPAKCPNKVDMERWTLFTDGASNSKGSRAGLVVISPSGVEFTYALRLNFASINNEAEYEALLAGLRMAKKIKVRNIDVKLATHAFDHLTKKVLVEVLAERSTDQKEVGAIVEEEEDNWMTPIIR